MSGDGVSRPAASATREPAPAASAIQIYDTTLRDGSQLEGISLTVDDKLRIAEQLDWLGVHYIEAGWPGANPKDDELYRRIPSELKLSTSRLVAFGSPAGRAGRVDSDETLRNLVESGAHRPASIVGSAGTTTSPRRCGPRSTKVWRWSPIRSRT